ncbi:MAG: hypothetical protein HY779_06025 [Rubrobacteridae bacterium]|nr:hypothetical protein [Rubrobacteridae bacterium]
MRRSVAVLSMFLGNLAALSQTQVRRLLGYSAVAHTGYLLIGLAAANQTGYTSLIFYFFVYSLAALGAFLIIFAMSERGLGEEIADFTGLHKRAPMLALAMAIFMFSLVGLPPLAGFMGKLFLFKAAVQSGLIWLALIGVVNSVVSLGYYVMVIRQMYLMTSDENETVTVSAPLYVSIMLIMLAVIAFGLYPTGLLSIINL